MSDVPEDYVLRTVLAMDLRPDDIIRGEGGGVVAERPTEGRDPIHPDHTHAVVKFMDGTSRIFLPQQVIDAYRRREPWSAVEADEQ